MFVNAFIGHCKHPSEQELIGELGPAKRLWDALLADLAKQHEVMVREWNSYSVRAGWSLRLKRGKRTIVYLSPSRHCFRVSFVLGQRAVEAARRSNLPRNVISLIDQAPRYAEGTGVHIPIKQARDLNAVKALAAIKITY